MVGRGEGEVITLLLLQAEPPRELVERLRSEKVEERLHDRMAFTRGTVVDHLGGPLSGTGSDFIVESDRIRIVPRTPARLFWLRGWREQGKKK